MDLTYSCLTILTNTEIETIVIKDNFLSGSIPRDFFNLKSLKAINFSRNNLSGFLSIRLGELINLEELILKGNKIAGYIPAEISNLKKLKGNLIFSYR